MRDERRWNGIRGRRQDDRRIQRILFQALQEIARPIASNLQANSGKVRAQPRDDALQHDVSQAYGKSEPERPGGFRMLAGKRYKGVYLLQHRLGAVVDTSAQRRKQ